MPQGSAEVGADMVWCPSPEAADGTGMAAFRRFVNAEHGLGLADTDALWCWSVDEIGPFWRTLWRFCDVIGDGPGAVDMVDGDRMPGARFFPEARLNFAENILRFAAAAPDAEAIVFRDESGFERRLTGGALVDRVGRLARHLEAQGLVAGDRIAAFVPNIPEAVIGALAAAAIGCVWSSCSPDFGPQGVIDRFSQIEPRLLIIADGYRDRKSVV